MISLDSLTPKTHPLESNILPLAITQPKLYDHSSSLRNQCLVAIIHTKPVIAILVPKLVAMAMSLSASGPPSNT